MYTWVLLVIAIVLCAYLLLWLHEARARELFGDTPHFPKLPFIGNMHQLFGDSQLLFNRLVELTKIMEETAKPFVLWVGPCPLIVVSDPEDVKAVTNTFIEKPYYYNFGRIWLGEGLVTAPGAIWKRSIKKLSNTFTSSIVDGYQDIFSEQAQRLVMKLKQEVGRKPFDAMEKYLSLTTLEVICQTALGVPQISDSIVTVEYYKAFNKTLELLLSRGLNLLYHPEIIYRLTPANKELKRCVAILHNVSETIMKKRKIEMEELRRKQEMKTESDNSKKKFKPFIDILLELSEMDSSLTDAWVKSEVDTIIVGGQETVATTLFFTLLMIGSKPRIQDLLVAEMKEIFGDSNRPVVKDDLVRMRYTEAVIQETLRLYPPVPGVMRYADKDLPLRTCTIPKGTACCVNAYGAGRFKRLWGEDASEYKPERWLEGPPEHPAAFLAFSYGRRSCIGRRYAMALLKTILAYCVRELVIESKAEHLKFKIDIALKPVSGHLMTVKLRN